MKKALLSLLLLLSISYCYSQTDSVDHWETVYHWNSPLKYLSGTEAPPADWNTLEYDDDSWDDFINIIGYGSFMDYLGISNDLELTETTTLYTRTNFTIADTSEICQLMLGIHFEDSYVAYLNGVEIMRENIGVAGEATSFDQYADTTRRYSFYAEILPEFETGVYIEKEAFKDALVNGENVLAIELHNDEYIRNSHHYFSVLFGGIKNTDIQFPEYINTQFEDSYNIFPFPVVFDSTMLPIVDITYPDSIYIPDEPKVMAKMRIIENPSAVYNHVSDTNLDYDGYIGIELRGSSSLNFYPKKSYGVETRDSMGENNNVILLGMPRENDWVLHGPYGDKTLIRNVLTYKLSSDLGHYAPRTRFVDLVKNGEYRGTYVLMEKIKRDNDRIDIAGLRADELAGDSLTGGYIIKIDKKEGDFDGWRSEFGSAENENYRNFYQYVYPKWDTIQEEQKAYIQNFMHQFELSLRNDNFDDLDNGYRKLINVESFIDYFIINELSKNMDAYRLSTYMYKDRDDNDGKLYMGPVWDYNLAYANYEYCGGFESTGWALDFAKNGGQCASDMYQLPFWWDRLLQDEGFTQQLQSRWNELRETTLSLNSINSDIDSLTTLTAGSRENNFNTWKGVFSTPVWPNGVPNADNYEGEITYMKNWISDRLDWLDANMGETRDRKNYVSIESPLAEEYVGIGAYPNPFNDHINFTFDLESSHSVQISIYNLNGQRIYDIVDGEFMHGSHNITWEGNQTNGSIVPPGMYFYRVIVDNKLLQTDKIIKQ